jgi:general secretion pathway protein K
VILQRQTGVALISAMLVVALATTAAVALISELQINMRRSTNMFTRDQAWQYLLGGEEFIKTLIKLAIDNDQLDKLFEEERILPVEGGTITGQVYDLQARLNINNLVNSKGELDNTNISSVRLENLLVALEIEPTRRDAIFDWLDTNDEITGNNGAEDNYYFGLDDPYRAANRPFTSPSELNLIRDMSAEESKKLLQVITVLPTPTKINVNTASEMVLKAIGVENFKAINENRPFKTLKDFEALKLLDKDQMKDLDIKTKYFLLKATAKIGRARLVGYSIIHRNDKGIMQVVSRSLGTL